MKANDKFRLKNEHFVFPLLEIFPTFSLLFLSLYRPEYSIKFSASILVIVNLLPKEINHGNHGSVLLFILKVLSHACLVVVVHVIKYLDTTPKSSLDGGGTPDFRQHLASLAV